jgi:hypothetical protein
VKYNLTVWFLISLLFILCRQRLQVLDQIALLAIAEA